MLNIENMELFHKHRLFMKEKGTQEIFHYNFIMYKITEYQLTIIKIKTT